MPDTGKKLSELRVYDLKEELEKRKLETSGAKATLVERLEQAIKSEGLDPAKYLFMPNTKATPKKAMDAKKVGGKLIEEIKIKEEPIDEDDLPIKTEDGGEEEYYDENDQFEGDDDDQVDQVGDVDDECVIIEDEVGDGNNDGADEEGDYHDGPEGEEENAGESNEESINLTIGEEEQKLLHDEVSKIKLKNYINYEMSKGAKYQMRFLLYKCVLQKNTWDVLPRVNIFCVGMVPHGVVKGRGVRYYFLQSFPYPTLDS
ncbi:PREDICTED: SAFB-like transcription modulator [Rhagoletis zephyria]|uniref:SAFB-like transcription modulator n=1 Tax=Rhagoletis zephyria TaxID=28612 RepID=UPI0008115208|nr:PREDICTED: SAFB-like transcription modulator [Rhagoletis zephyria]XP_017489047.1 PREDICTED: SAFB-like transcription modulator [Rhagoletis zephyria]